MKRNIMTSIFISVDGPNGVGKSTIINQLTDKLIKNGIKVKATKEPTDSTLGNFIRDQSEYIKGNALACLVAGDRYEHLKNEIIPALKEYQIVLCDRYILSSFILQGIDGVDYTFINDLNSKIIMPDIQIVLYASVEVIQKRLKERDVLTRFEKNNKTALEIEYLEKGIKYLSREGINIHKFDTEEDITKNIEKIYDVIISYLKNKVGV